MLYRVSRDSPSLLTLTFYSFQNAVCCGTGASMFHSLLTLYPLSSFSIFVSFSSSVVITLAFHAGFPGSTPNRVEVFSGSVLLLRDA